jgi:hypothetical protein
MRILNLFLSSGQAISYYPDEVTLSLQFSNMYSLNQQNNVHQNNCSIINTKWTPDYRVLTIVYDNGSIALFSVLGSLLCFCNNLSM